MSGTILSTLYLWTYLIILATLRSGYFYYYYPYFADEETEA